MPEPKLTYGLSLRANRLVHVSSVPNGKECGLICPACKEVLIAVGNKEGKEYKREAHFRHYSNVDCAGARMSALHRLAQELIQDQKRVLLPEYKGKYYHQDASIITFDEVRLEESVQIKGGGLRRVDVLGIKEGVEYWIEIKVTHAVDEDKRNDIKANNSNCIEIDLLDLLNTWFDEESVTERLLNNKNSHRWLNIPDLDMKEAQAKKEFEEKRKEINAQKKRLVCDKLIYSFRELHSLKIEFEVNAVCSMHKNCPLYNHIGECEGEINQSIEFCDYCDNIETITEYDGIPADLILSSQQHPSLVVLFQIIMPGEEKCYSIGGKHRSIQLHFSSSANVAYFAPEKGLTIDNSLGYTICSYHFKPKDVEISKLEQDGINRPVRTFLSTITIYRSGKAFFSEGLCDKIVNNKKPCVAAYVVSPELVDYNHHYAAAYLARQNGLSLKDCAICINNRDRRGIQIDCSRRTGVLKNIAGDCASFNENTELVDNKSYLFANEDFIKIK